MKIKIQHTSEYVNIHIWIKYHYGKANKCENPTCLHKPTKRYEWALKHDFVYEKNINNFWQLCVPCHKIYDYTVERNNKLKEQKRTIETRMKMSMSHKGKLGNARKQILCLSTGVVYSSVLDAQAKTSVSNSAISNMLNDRSRTAGGFIWQII